MTQRPADVHHQTELVIGGAPVVERRSHHLVVLPADYHFDSTVPATRSDCPKPQSPDGRLCPHYHCRHNTWHVAGEDRPGRRWKEGELPKETPQLSFDVTGKPGPRIDDSEPSENTLYLHSEDNCALDHLERQRKVSDALGIDWREPMTHAQVAKVCGGMTERQVRRVVRKALGKLRGNEEAKELLKLMVEK